MSKRKSIGGGGTNTLFSYFTKSPISSPKTNRNEPALKSSTPKAATPKSSLATPNLPTTPKTTHKSLDFGKRLIKDEDDTEIKTVNCSDDENEEMVGHKIKRRRIIDSDSDRENDSDNGKSTSKNTSKKEDKIKSNSSTPVPKKKLKKEVSTPIINLEERLKSIKTEEHHENIEAPDDLSQTFIDEPVVWLHNKLEFLKPKNTKDANGKKPNDPMYDPKTLHVPYSYLEQLTPAMRQWWEIKSQNFDCILFFKVGKFYELYHMDADVGVNELGFTYMKGEFAHSGFPEQSYDRMATSLVERGYKVARIEQTETPDMMQERLKKMKKTTKFDKVVNREVCQITNRGTQVFGQQVMITNNHQPNYMLAIAESHSLQSSRFGICFIDTSLAEFHIGEFEDDNHCSRLLTLLSHNPPVLVLHERNNISLRTKQIFKTVLCNTLKEQLLPEMQFWNAEKTLKTMAEKYYSHENKIEWPDVIKSMQDDGDHLGLTPSKQYKLAIKSIGGCLWYLQKCLVDQQIMSMASYFVYVPPDNVHFENEDDLETTVAARIAATNFNRHMVLDAITLSNLKISEEENSLLSTLDHSCTKFGKRLLNHWVCAPSCEKNVIIERQDAVKELMENSNLLQEIRLILSALPDLERMLAQIHTFGNKIRSKSHPDSRAIFFEQKLYNKKKIQDFIATLNGFDTLECFPKKLEKCSSKLLLRLTQKEPIGQFPDMCKTLQFFKTGFDYDEALKEGVIAPGYGVDMEFDSIQNEIKIINNELNDYLKVQEKHFGCRINYFGNDKKRFQLEIPESNAKRADRSYYLEGQKKGSKPVKRYHTDETREFLKRMIQAEDQQNMILKDISRRMFEKFSNEHNLWKSCVELIAILDVLTALAVYGQNQNQYCFPDIVDHLNGPILEIENGYHPCMKQLDDFVPNGITLGGQMAPLALLTGPNMGGKSTLMRQVGLLIIMSQMGCPIPAESCRLSLIDRIFTRLGAQDDIMAGHSTFLVELSETSAILKHATVNSLVLLDELGRGTATYDGTAIAAAVVNFLADLKCRTLFSTHYHNLVDNFHNDNRVNLGHMACMVENEDSGDPTQETVTFLYKYSDGPCPKSYGFNAAKLAGMPNCIIKRAHELSKEVEATALKRRLFSKVLSNKGINEIKDLLVKLKGCIIK